MANSNNRFASVASVAGPGSGTGGSPKSGNIPDQVPATNPDAAGPVEFPHSQRSPGQMRDPLAITRSISLRLRVTLLAAIVVGVAVAVMAGAAYAVVYRALYTDVDTQLVNRADSLTVLVNSGVLDSAPQLLIGGTLYSTDVSVGLVYPNGRAVWIGDMTYGTAEREVAASRPGSGVGNSSLRTVDNKRVIARKIDNGDTLILVQDLTPTDAVLNRLAWVLVIVGGCGVVLAAVAGTTVARAGLRPVARLTQAAERVARTDDLRPIPVTGDDELARLTESFNAMLRALAESRDRQSRLVADAGHELRTPLTSLRTNLELLIAASAPGAPPVPPEDMADLRTDVMAQIEELSTLVGDLVDLAREDAPEVVYEEIDLAEVLDRALDRVRRRRSDVDFEVRAMPWYVFGEPAGLSRAVLNVLDNAAKWSPAGCPVRVTLMQVDSLTADLVVEDGGPGIPPEERTLVFERFYRSAASRSMPGSGLGLAIVRQVVGRIGGTVSASESAMGGAMIRMRLPGRPVPVEPAPQVVSQ